MKICFKEWLLEITLIMVISIQIVIKRKIQEYKKENILNVMIQIIVQKE